MILMGFEEARATTFERQETAVLGWRRLFLLKRIGSFDLFGVTALVQVMGRKKFIGGRWQILKV
jgi:hypothetical protein